MKSLVLALTLIFSGCGGYCTTDHGMYIMGLWPNGELPDDFECSKYNNVESKMVQYLAYSRGAGGPERLNGYQVWLRPLDHWPDPYGRYEAISGYTSCPSKQMHIGTDKYVFAHEIAHALQNCNALLPSEDGADDDHANWFRDGIIEIIGKVPLD